eukprot:jgi/Ulvmu1/7715/UM039_0021.1
MGTKNAISDSIESTSKPADAKNSQNAETPPHVPLLSLFTGADTWDCLAVGVGVAGALVNGATFPMFAFVFGGVLQVIDALNSDDIKDEIAEASLMFLVIGCVSLVTSICEMGVLIWSGVRRTARLRQRYLAAALTHEIAYYDTTQTSGAIIDGLNVDCAAVQAATSERLGHTINNLTQFLLGLAVGFVRGWELSLVMVATFPVIAAAGAIMAKAATAGDKQTAAAYAAANDSAAQAIANVRTVVAFQAEKPVLQRYVDMLAYPKRVSIRMSALTGTANGSINAAVFFTYAVAFLYGGKLVRDSDYTAGVVVQVMTAMLIGGFALGQAAPDFSYYIAGRGALGRLMRVINRKPLVALEGGTIPAEPMHGDVEIEKVTFAYPARPDVTIFSQLTLHIPAGQTVALVGASGSGKSTVIQLLQRFYDPAAGTIHVDGTDIRTLSLEWYRNNVGLVSQEPTLFATTIHENIAMGRAGATDAEIEAAARSANAHRFIQKLPEAYHTQVGERGVQLSGGQKQRIAIARALLKNPRLLLLDEATSALDTVSERLVQAALESLAEGRTSIVVAHRLSTIRNADKIAVMKAGAVVEEGTHSELYAVKESVYRSLVQLQEQATDRRGGGGPAIDLEAAAAADEAAAAGIAAEHAAQRGEAPAGAEGGSTASPQVSGRAALGAGGKAGLGGEVAGKGKGEGGAGKDEAEEEADELTEEEKAVSVGIVRLLNMNRREWPYLAAGILATAGIGTLQPLFAIILSRVTALLTPDEPASNILRPCMYIFALGIAQLLCGAIQASMFGLVGANLAERVRILFMRAVLYMEIAWFDRDANTSGNLTSRLARDAPTVRGAVGDTLGVIVQNGVTLTMGFIIAFVNGWKMTLVVLAVLPLLGFSTYIQTAVLTGQAVTSDATFGLANQAAYEAVQSLRTVHSYNLQGRVAAAYHTLVAVPVARMCRAGLTAGLLFGLSQFILFGFMGLAFWYGGKLVEEGEMDLQSMLTVFYAILLSTLGLGDAQMAFPKVASGKKAVARVFRVIDRPSLIDASKPDGERPDEASKGQVALESVTFAYPSRPDVPVFRNFSLVAPAGCMTALVGESGSGKSTIVNLVERFYDVDAGAVMLDGTNVKSLDISWLRSQVGLVSQEPALFNGTIMENVQLGKPGATPEEVRAACEVANAVEFIERQPDHYGTRLGEGGGISLSGGQKQRIAIARAVLKDPRVLLLDEATSALDAESERVVQAALDRLMAGRTSIVIAHRLTTVRAAHKIAVVQRGVVLEEGTHDELMARGNDGAYVQLARAQAGM